MGRRSGAISAMAVLSLVLTRSALLAQRGPDNDPDGLQGYVDNVFHHSSVDSVNLYNGQLSVPIAIGPSYPIGPALKLQLVMTYGSRIWEYGHPSGSPIVTPKPIAGDPALGIGWTFTFGAIKVCKILPPGTGRMCYVGPDGSQHIFDMPDPARGAGYFKTSDASQLSLRNVATDPSGEGPFDMWDGDGNHHVFGWHVANFDDPQSDFHHDFGRGRDGWYLTSLSDPFGNAYSVSYKSGTGPCWSYATPCTYQTMSCPATAANLWIPQTVTLPTPGPNNVITIGTDASQMVSSVTLPVSGGTTTTWIFSYQSDTYNETCGGGQINLRELQSIQLPGAVGSYQFAYKNDANCVTGLLSHLQIPTGATSDYLYGLYSFYHGRLAALSQTCAPIGPDPTAEVEVSAASQCIAAQRAPNSRTALSSGTCTDQPNYLDQQLGIVQRTETTSGVTAVTDYVQLSFPFGEQGAAPKANCDALGRCGPQTLTVVVAPADVDGRRRAKGTLFWAAPKNPNQTQVYAGERTGADIETRDYEDDPTRSINVSMPVCGGAQVNSFCADGAIRVTQRSYEYDVPTSEIGNRRMLSEIAYHQPAAANGTCTSCKNHSTAFSNTNGKTWEGNGRHYNVETHGGNLGNDARTVTTNWTPQLTSRWLPNLYDTKIESDPTLSVNHYFEFNSSNGFLNCTFLHDPGPGRVFFKRRFPAADGTVAQDFSATSTGFPSPPYIGQCIATYPSPPVPSGPAIGTNSDAFGKVYTYQNGLLTSARWINGNAAASWYAKRLTRDPSTGWITTSYDSAGLATGLGYDVVGRVTSVAPPGEAATAVSYPATTRTIATRNGGSGLSTYQEYVYDGLGRLAREIQLRPASTYAVRVHGFDGAGHRVYDSEWGTCGSPTGDCLTTSPSGSHRSNLDPFARDQSFSTADGAITTTSYADTYSLYSDTKKSVTSPCVNGTWRAGACSGGTPSTSTYFSDAFGRLTSVTEPSGDVTSYSYDLNGKLRSVAQGVQTRSFTYDPAGFLRSQSTPEEGLVTYVAIGALANVRQETHAGGVTLTRTYDFAGRLTSTASNEGGSRTYLANTYDEAAGSSAGKLTSRIASNYAVVPTSTVRDVFAYSGVGGRLSSRQSNVSGALSLSETQSWSYNALGLVAHHSHPRSATDAPLRVSTDYDAGLPVALYMNGLGVLSGVAYTAWGGVRSYTTGLGVGHDVTTTVTPDPTLLARPVQIFSREQASGATLFDTASYLYDGIGNVKSIGPDVFGYDARSRLVSASLQIGSGSSSQTYAYDRYGNMTSRSIGGSPINFPVDPYTNHLMGAVYDARGSVGQNGGETFVYDGLERMMQATTTNTWKYLYDGANERIAKVPPTGAPGYQFRDEANRVATEMSGSIPSRDNAFLGRLLVASYSNCAVGGNCSYGGSAKGPWQFFASDHLGTPRLITGTSGEQLDLRKYWPYGDEAVGATDDPQRLRLAGMERDAEGSRYYDHARSHDFGLARFLSPDLLGGKSAVPGTWNRYVYASNNPINRFDGNGLADDPTNPSGPRPSTFSDKAWKTFSSAVFIGIKLGVRLGVAAAEFSANFAGESGKIELKTGSDAIKVKGSVEVSPPTGKTGGAISYEFVNGMFVDSNGNVGAKKSVEIIPAGSSLRVTGSAQASVNVPASVEAGGDVIDAATSAAAHGPVGDMRDKLNNIDGAIENNCTHLSGNNRCSDPAPK